jgi:hypothetical protein
MKMISFLFVLVFGFAAHADIEWSGTYRVEGVKIENADMNDVERNKQYMLHHLVLSPKITAYDGLTIQGRFDILNSGQYPNSQVGQFFGSGIGDTTAATQTADNNNILSDRQQSDFIAVNSLYLTYAHEFGILTVGRAPLSFGLGMSYNPGTGAFDHWFDNRDLVAYKVTMGNLSFTPMIAKVVENDIGFEDDINDYMAHFQYENPDTDLKLGVMYRSRHAGRHGNESPTSPVFGDNTISPQGQGSFKGEYWNLYFSRWVGESFKIGLELASQKGKTGVVSAGGGQVELDGFGVALEMDWMPKESNWSMNLKAGLASGDDPETTNSYEGFIFDRNYDVAFLMFNHPLGQYDMFRTAGIRKTNATTIQDLPSSRVDEEAISNVMYFAPKIKYKWSGKFDTELGLTYAQLSSDPLVGVEVDKSVGFEVDIALTYKPYDNVQWVNRIGFLSPGAAFEAGGTYKKETAYGLETKAAITF